MKPRAVLDSNVVVSALVFEKGRLAWLRHASMAAQFQPLASRQTAEELLRVLSYPKFRLTPAEVEELLAEYLPFVETVDVPRAGVTVPKPPDPGDRIFLELAVAGRAAFLVTGDRRLLALSSTADCRLLAPADFQAVLQLPA